MKKTKFDIENDFHRLLRDTPLTKEANGTLSVEGQRRANSTAEDIIVSLTSSTADVMASGIVSVLVYVPDIPQAGKNGALVPNRPRLTELARLLSDWGESLGANGDYYVTLREAVGIVSIPEIRQHAASLRLNFRILQS